MHFLSFLNVFFLHLGISGKSDIQVPFFLLFELKNVVNYEQLKLPIMSPRLFYLPCIGIFHFQHRTIVMGSFT